MRPGGRGVATLTRGKHGWGGVRVVFLVCVCFVFLGLFGVLIWGRTVNEHSACPDLLLL